YFTPGWTVSLARSARFCPTADRRDILFIMKKVGILVGREVTFPESMIKSINEKGGGDVAAEMITVGGIRLDEPKRWDVIIDRISHEVPFYRATLKRFALEGTY